MNNTEKTMDKIVALCLRTCIWHTCPTNLPV